MHLAPATVKHGMSLATPRVGQRASIPQSEPPQGASRGVTVGQDPILLPRVLHAAHKQNGVCRPVPDQEDKRPVDHYPYRVRSPRHHLFSNHTRGRPPPRRSPLPGVRPTNRMASVARSRIRKIKGPQPPRCPLHPPTRTPCEQHSRSPDTVSLRRGTSVRPSLRIRMRYGRRHWASPSP